eukprot:CAMPEP_0178920776 /NCGR_PEP_ID=MMETSP0786-20121207/15187_1 /TAXON_ID=186022 /ORGANISM="Thalassionema frauenfeldii, Strain CCMP 1798" /LENGTH=663 /DNA_ID=CAMNT_0020594869 /DNA_START=208 /DNA_END=2199 /DNA_ORIENTATION=-
MRLYHGTRIFSTAKDGSPENDEEENMKRKKEGAKQYQIQKAALEGRGEELSTAFAELANKEGFDESTSFYAEEDDFEDDFDEDDFIDFGSENPEDDMDRRIAAAQSDVSRGKVSVSNELEDFSSREDEFRKLGFKHEVNPFGNDETPRRDEFRLVTDAMICSACGSDFQCSNETRPGYLPEEKFNIQVKLSKIEELQNLQKKASENAEWSPEDEIEYLIQTSDGDVDSKEFDEFAEIDIDKVAEDMGLDIVKATKKKMICKRCHGLQNFGKVDTALRPGWTDEPLMSQSRFRALLAPLREKPSVIIALVDLFDFAGSVLPELDAIAGDNPVIIAANKVDLLPSKMGQHRAENWVRRELEYMGIKSIANVGGAVRLVSCKTGFGIAGLLSKARQVAEEIDTDVFVVGAANAGKSTLINYVLERNSRKEPTRVKRRAGNANAIKGAVTVSPLPGTTLKFIKVDLGEEKSLYDTPGLLVPGTLTQLLTPEELKVVVPKKKVEPITFRVASGKCVLVGGLARIEVIGDTKPFLFTFFVANDIKLHPTSSANADTFIETHTGGLLTPPLQKREENFEWEHHDVEIEGAGWKEAAADVVLCGLGWVAVTGAGVARIRITVPKGIIVSVRPPLMPFDVWEVASRYTGGRAVRKVSRNKSGSKRRRGVGRN